MNTRAFRLLFTWNIVLTVLLLIALAFAAISAQAANDPPVQVFTATYAHGTGVGGNAVGDKAISSTTFSDVLTVPANFTGQTHNHYCAVIASARVLNPATGGSTGHRYEFGVTYDGTSAASYDFSNMTLELSDNNSIDDPNYMPVTTNRVLGPLSAAAHTMRFQARKVSAGSPTMTIDNASMTVLCFKKYQTFLDTLQPEGPGTDNLANDK